ncbi:MAG: molybdopterin converting factor subunit 1 [Pseudomonadota bacterium]
MKLHMLYFARLRERFGVGEETLELAGATVADLLAVLQARGGAWAEELAAGRAFRVAVDQAVVAPDAPLADGAEVAIFPPVTGG